MLSLWPTDPGRSWTKLGLLDKPFSSLCCLGWTGYRSCFLNLLRNIVKYFVETTDSLRKPNILLAMIKDLLLWVDSFCSFPNKATSALLLAIYHRRPSLSLSRPSNPCPLFINNLFLTDMHSNFCEWSKQRKVGIFVRKSTMRIGGRSGTPRWGSENL